jgi:asparaginyl-tRNA synthetase
MATHEDLIPACGTCPKEDAVAPGPGDQFVRTADLYDKAGSSVALRGWVYAVRSSGRISFLQFRDGTGICQLIAAEGELSQAKYEEARHLSIETAIEVKGRVVLTERAPGGVEILVEDFRVVGSSEGYPIGRKDHGPDFKLDLRHLWIRSPKQAAILRIRSNVEFAARLFLKDDGFFEFNSPILTPTACEATTQLFHVDYFGLSAYLSQSGQLYSEAGIGALEKVFCFGPCFRAEQSKTRKHLTEFWAVEPEMAWFDAEASMRLQERLIKSVVAYIIEHNERDLALLERDPRDIDIADGAFEVMTYDDAVEHVRKAGFDMAWGKDFGAKEETYLVRMMARPFFVHKYPAEVRAFYIERDTADPRLALSTDTFLHGRYGCEICTGGERALSVDALQREMERLELKREDYEWYLDLRRYGSVPHSGFGMGIERTVRWICGIQHIRETIPFPRLLNRIRP